MRSKKMSTSDFAFNFNVLKCSFCLSFYIKEAGFAKTG